MLAREMGLTVPALERLARNLAAAKKMLGNLAVMKLDRRGRRITLEQERAIARVHHTIVLAMADVTRAYRALERVQLTAPKALIDSAANGLRGVLHDLQRAKPRALCGRHEPDQAASCEACQGRGWTAGQ